MNAPQTAHLGKTPCTIVTGFLGAGKTTLVRHLLENAQGKKLAVLVNEFGDLGFDGEFLKGCGIAGCSDEDVVELPNGCICCTVADDFVPALEKLLNRPNPPEHILIETSGLALPKPLVTAFNWPAIRSRVTVDGVIAVVDGPAVAEGQFADDPDALAAQKAADTMPESKNSTSPSATNLILYGPPGTGKTYQTAWEAVRLCLGEEAAAALTDDGRRDALMTEYRRLVDEGRIEFVTFHQSMSYEEFVEGLRPTAGTSDEHTGFSLQVEKGIFVRAAERALKGPEVDGAIRLDGRQVFKMSIGNSRWPEDAALFQAAIADGYALFGFDDIDWSDERFAGRAEIARAMREVGLRNADATESSPAVRMTDDFRNKLEIGDILIVSKGNSLVRAIGEVTGAYEFHPRGTPGYSHRRAVRWLWWDFDGIGYSNVYDRAFTQQTIYRLSSGVLNVAGIEALINKSPSGDTLQDAVLIIDEINRANISKVFGELITLLEPDKRLGMPNEIRVVLPYSKRSFGVPANLHIIGTMNTADRSIALLDTALRRRFIFRELMPDPSVLRVNVDGIDLQKLLTTINDRIEYLFDREHQIGHAYFTGCRTRDEVDEVMRHKVIPLLAEYFYEDWSRVAAVLGDAAQGPSRFLEARRLSAPNGLDETGLSGDKLRWRVKDRFDFSEFAV